MIALVAQRARQAMLRREAAKKQAAHDLMAKQEEEREKALAGATIEAFKCARKAVYDSLKAPSTASFADPADNSVVRIDRNGDVTQDAYFDYFRVRIIADAQNSYGATLRSVFTVSVTPTGELSEPDKFRAVVIDEKPWADRDVSSD